ncbi:SURF1 family protein [Dyella kyungheensis]|uniref:SURF1-like protein n=1 Tax=Dyella kyungheensis TaxID=1242174 RepID=A0ABS2JMK9_9GAMM|nr:SURF1 family protein [Dyella kyungheensis]MBM7120272.1 SURF1 family protein [Dyella kyungheensis]
MSVAEEPGRPPRGPVALALLTLLGVVLFAGFVALGTWQVYRLGWKRELIARVDARAHALPSPAPARAQWRDLTAQSSEYSHVALRGTFAHDQQTLVWASTDLGSGYWVVTPLRQADGSVVLVNRGFVLTDWCGISGRCERGPQGEVDLTGLLRMSEQGNFIRHNDPARDSWYTRDVSGIAAKRGLRDVAPYFVDEDAAPGSLAAGQRTWPQGGLTVIAFPNNHLSYLITWYVLALMVLAAGVYVARDELRLRRHNP